MLESRERISLRCADNSAGGRDPLSNGRIAEALLPRLPRGAPMGR